MKLRTFSLALATLLFTLAIHAIAPQQLAVTLYKVSMIVTAALTGYWIDRALFPYARPHLVYSGMVNASMLRRAVLVAAAMLAVGLGA